MFLATIALLIALFATFEDSDDKGSCVMFMGCLGFFELIMEVAITASIVERALS